MARREIDAFWDRKTRNNLNENFKELYNEYREAGLNAKEAREKAHEAVMKSDEAMALSERTQKELSQAILEGDSSPLGGQLSVGADGTIYSNPQERLVTEFNSVNQKLAQSPNGSKAPWSVWSEFEFREVNVQWFSHLVVDGDWTVAVQRACDVSQKKVFFPNDGTVYKLGKIGLSNNLEIDIRDNKLIGTDIVIFYPTKPLDKIKIHGCGGVEFEGVAGEQYNHFFANYAYNGVIAGNNQKFPQGDLLTYNPIEKCIISDNKLNYAKVAVLGDTLPRIKNNEWEHDEGVSSAPYYLFISKGKNGSEPVYKDNFWLQNNIFKVYTPDGTNKDIVKVSGAIKHGKILGNHFENRNPLSGAQVDVYTGGHHLNTSENSFVNVQFHRKQVVGENIYGETPAEMGFDTFSNNDIIYEEGFIMHRGAAVYLHGSLFTAINNRVKIKNTDPELVKSAFYIDADERGPSGNFDTNESLAFGLSLNVVDFSESVGDSYFVNAIQGINADPSTFPEFITVIGNTQVGGTRFTYGSFDNSAALGNIWLRNDNGVRFINNINGGMSIGNISENKNMIIEGKTEGNSSNLDIPRIVLPHGDLSEIDVSGRSVFRVEGSGSRIVNLTGGVVGQKVTLISFANDVSIRNTENIYLNGGVGFTMNHSSSITLIKMPDRWVEVSRSST